MSKVIKLPRIHSPFTGEKYPRCHCGKTVYSGVLCYQHFQEKNARIRKRLQSTGLY